MKGQIVLEGMTFHCRHGLLECERETPQMFVVDFEGEAEITDAVNNDDIAGTVDYGEVYRIVAARMEQPVGLLERLCGTIVDDIAGRLPALERFSVTVSKHCPPVGGQAEWARVRIEHRR